VEVISHQTPALASPPVHDNRFGKSAKKLDAIEVVAKDVHAVVASCRDVMHARAFISRTACHFATVADAEWENGRDA
jgi:hypothetical protein